jgi:hypothetical protein
MTLRSGIDAPADLVVDELASRCDGALRELRAVTSASLDDGAIAVLAARYRARLAAAIRLATPGGRPATPPEGVREPTAAGDAAPATEPARATGEVPPDGAPGPAGTTAESTRPDGVAAACAFVAAALEPRASTWAALLGWLAGGAIGGVLAPDAERGHSWFDRLDLGRPFADAARGLGIDDGAAWWSVETVRHLFARPGEAALAWPEDERPGRLVRAWFADEQLARWLGVNRHEGVAYINREAFEQALGWMAVLVAVAGDADPASPDAPGTRALVEAWRLARRLEADAAEAGYRVGRLVELAGQVTR